MTLAPAADTHLPSNVEQELVQRQYDPSTGAVPPALDPFLVLAALLHRHGLSHLLPALRVILEPHITPPPAQTVAVEPVPTVALTERESQVLHGMARGQSNRAIGSGLYLAEDTVKTHARRLFKKLGARDRANAVQRGWELGILGGTR